MHLLVGTDLSEGFVPAARWSFEYPSSALADVLVGSVARGVIKQMETSIYLASPVD